jgi:plastocyanin
VPSSSLANAEVRRIEIIPRGGTYQSVTHALRHTLAVVTALTLWLMASCGGNAPLPMPPASPTPPPVTASAYILPGAVSLNDWAFGDEPVVIYKGERLRWVNADTVTHLIVADSPGATDFRNSTELSPNGGEQSFTMTRLGTTGIHCSIHPNMTGTLIVREH